MSISEHTLASQLPTAPESPNPALLRVAPDLGSLVSRPGDPRTLDDYLQSERPVLGLHIVSFTDATIVTLSWPHVLFDASTYQSHPLALSRSRSLALSLSLSLSLRGEGKKRALMTY